VSHSQQRCKLLFDNQKDPFAAPLSRASHVGDINTGRCYQKSHRALVKKKGVDIILPSILAMDKTHIDLGGWLQMVPITISHGLLKHSVRCLPIAMPILGYINHSTPARLLSLADLDTEFNAPTGLPKEGTVVLDAPLRHMNNLTWSTYLLNKTHMQIQFILEESGFCHCKIRDSNGSYITTKKSIQLCLNHMCRSSLVTPRVMTVFAGTTLHGFLR
jgi:hypothetical protein